MATILTGVLIAAIWFAAGIAFLIHTREPEQ